MIPITFIDTTDNDPYCILETLESVRLLSSDNGFAVIHKNTNLELITEYMPNQIGQELIEAIVDIARYNWEGFKVLIEDKFPEGSENGIRYVKIQIYKRSKWEVAWTKSYDLNGLKL